MVLDKGRDRARAAGQALVDGAELGAGGLGAGRADALVRHGGTGRGCGRRPGRSDRDGGELRRVGGGRAEAEANGAGESL